MIRLAFLASGRGSNLEALILACQSGQLDAEPALVIVDREGAGALQVAARLGVPARLLKSRDFPTREAHERAIAAELQRHRVEFVALAGYQRMLSPFLIGYLYEPRLGQSRIANIHPADTRAYQGLHGYRWAWEAGLRETAVTVHYVDEGMDTGAIIACEPLPIESGETLESLERRGLAREHELYPRALGKVLKELQSLCAAF